MKDLFLNQEGAIPVVAIIILAIATLLGAGAVGFLLGNGVQGFALTIAFTVLGVIFLLNGVTIARWVKELKREIKQ